jgi:PfaD family protein
MASQLVSIGAWSGDAVAFDREGIAALARLPREPVHVVHDSGTGCLGLAQGGELRSDGEYALLASLGPLYPEWLGDRDFTEAHGLRFPYVAGEMATGLTTARLVIAMAGAGMLGFFGAAGLSLAETEHAIDEIEAALGDSGAAWGSNLIHSPNEPELEQATVDLYLRRGVRRVSASAFMSLAPSVVRYAFSGISITGHGEILRPNHVFAKVSRPEVARAFIEPPSAELLSALVESGGLTSEEASLASRLPTAEDVTVEADSGGHTDNRPLGVLLPLVLAIRDKAGARHGYARPVRVGAAGGIGTPSAAASAFALGAAYILTGSVNQSAVESGASPAVKEMLAAADVADVVMAAAADMFELGVKVQVLRRGTLFGVRAAQLYQLYSSHESLEEIPASVVAQLERDLFRAPVAGIWETTRAYWEARDPRESERAARDPKHRMALVFRWYLGMCSRWAKTGEQERRTDYQVWCGPAMGGFNDWVRGSFLEPIENRGATQIALNILEGAAVLTRAHQLRTYGVPLPPEAFDFRARPLA